MGFVDFDMTNQTTINESNHHLEIFSQQIHGFYGVMIRHQG